MKNKTKLNLYRNSFVSIFILLVLFSCSKEDGNRRNAGDVKTSVVPEGAGKVDFIDHGQDPSALFALANEDYYFEKWTGDVNSTENPLTITINSPMNITANFKQVPFITMEQVGEGTVYKSVEKIELENKYVAYLQAKPKEGWEFLGWSGDINSTENPLTVTVDAPKNIVATFRKIPLVIIQQVGNGQVQQSVIKDEITNKYVATLEAKPERTWEFAGWTGDVNSSDNPLIITLEEDKNITATFTELEREFNPPVIESFTFSPEVVDVTESDQVVTVTAHVTDESGVYSIPSAYISDGRPGDTPQGDFKLASGTLKDGIFTVKIMLPKGVLPGEWGVGAYPFCDVFSNYSDYAHPTNNKKTLTVINTKYNTPAN